MASNDVITKADIEGLKVYIDSGLAEVKTEIRVNATKIDAVKDSLNWDFTTLTIVITLVGFVITLAPMFRDMFREKRKEKSDDEIRRLIREEFAKLKEEA
ncbi:MAG: hypothetical protein IJG51_08185 [Synergistaceae bacterium]|nr:hypothetical protein [Synergistaceae bacterium]MBQ3346518.1 hypothetical protein [Synergistaceae bacterium]MBQ3398853.1 hypothetical protein [Synergistaceae bacterium]MBQ3760314.1 hypothetical protein [Synergistaceae bacterium]MBQ6002429.1 hypothetical protein [Synergistaceae bacterium]